MIDDMQEEDPYAAEKRYCYDAIQRLLLEYEKAAKPYVDRLVGIANCEMPARFVTLEQARALGLFDAALKERER